MTAQEARTHIRYSGWASRKVLEAALALPADELAKPMNVSHESIAKTLTHIYFADAIWYSELTAPRRMCYSIGTSGPEHIRSRHIRSARSSELRTGVKLGVLRGIRIRKFG
jgi:uncharacterized damage-inducible protein DinB